MQAALSILTAHGWSAELIGLLRDWLGAAQPNPELGGILTAFAKDAGVQDLVAQALRSPKTSTETRLVLLETAARAPLDHLPATWTAELRWSLDHDDPRVVRQAVAAIRAAGVIDFDASVLAIAKDSARTEDLRVDALVAVAPRLTKMESGLFGFLRNAWIRRSRSYCASRRRRRSGRRRSATTSSSASRPRWAPRARWSCRACSARTSAPATRRPGGSSSAGWRSRRRWSRSPPTRCAAR